MKGGRAMGGKERGDEGGWGGGGGGGRVGGKVGRRGEKETAVVEGREGSGAGR